jgi:hypothetical protein
MYAASLGAPYSLCLRPGTTLSRQALSNEIRDFTPRQFSPHAGGGSGEDFNLVLVWKEPNGNMLRFFV